MVGAGLEEGGPSMAVRRLVSLEHDRDRIAEDAGSSGSEAPVSARSAQPSMHGLLLASPPFEP